MLCLQLSGCGMLGFITCLDLTTDDTKCVFLHSLTSAPAGWNMVPPLPDINGAATPQGDKTTSVFVSANNSVPTDTGISVNGGDIITIQATPNSPYPANQDGFLVNGTVSMCNTSGQCVYQGSPIPTTSNMLPGMGSSCVFTNTGPIVAFAMGSTPQTLSAQQAGSTAAYTASTASGWTWLNLQMNAYPECENDVQSILRSEESYIVSFVTLALKADYADSINNMSSLVIKTQNDINNFFNSAKSLPSCNVPISNCSPTGFGSPPGCSGSFNSCPATLCNSGLYCNGTNGQGLSIDIDTTQPTYGSGNMLYNISNQFAAGAVANATPFDPNNTVFANGSAIILNQTLNQTYSIYIPYWNIYNNCISLGSGGAAYSGNIFVNYITNYSATGCWGINGGPVQNTPSGSNIGQLQFTIGSGGTTYAVTNGYTKFTAPETGELYLKIYDTNYTDNVGQLEVQVSVPIPNPTSFMDQFTNNIIIAVSRQVFAMSQTMFKSIVSNAEFQRIVNICLVLYIIVYAISFTVGLVAVSQKDVLVRLIKMAIILALISDDSWYFFNTYLFQAFSGGLQYLTSIASGGDGSSTSLFNFADQLTSYLLSTSVWARILTFLILPKIGWFLFIMILSSVLTCMVAIIEALVAYLLALTAISIFIAIGPLFIVLILFQHTRSIFDEWIKLMTAMVLQTTLLFSCIAIVSELVLLALNDLLQDSQYTCILPFSLFEQISLFCIYLLMPNPLLIKQILTNALILYIFAELLRKLPDFAKSVAFFLASAGAAAVSGAADVRGGLTSAVDNVKGLVGMDSKSAGRRKEKGTTGKANRKK